MHPWRLEALVGIRRAGGPAEAALLRIMDLGEYRPEYDDAIAESRKMPRKVFGTDGLARWCADSW